MRFLLTKILSRIKKIPEAEVIKLPPKKKTPLPKINLYEYFKLEPTERINYKP